MTAPLMETRQAIWVVGECLGSAGWGAAWWMGCDGPPVPDEHPALDDELNSDAWVGGWDEAWAEGSHRGGRSLPQLVLRWSSSPSPSAHIPLVLLRSWGRIHSTPVLPDLLLQRGRFPPITTISGLLLLGPVVQAWHPIPVSPPTRNIPPAERPPAVQVWMLSSVAFALIPSVAPNPKDPFDAFGNRRGREPWRGVALHVAMWKLLVGRAIHPQPPSPPGLAEPGPPQPRPGPLNEERPASPQAQRSPRSPGLAWPPGLPGSACFLGHLSCLPRRPSWMLAWLLSLARHTCRFCAICRFCLAMFFQLAEFPKTTNSKSGNGVTSFTGSFRFLFRDLPISVTCFASDRFTDFL